MAASKAAQKSILDYYNTKPEAQTTATIIERARQRAAAMSAELLAQREEYLQSFVPGDIMNPAARQEHDDRLAALAAQQPAAQPAAAFPKLALPTYKPGAITSNAFASQFGNPLQQYPNTMPNGLSAMAPNAAQPANPDVYTAMMQNINPNALTQIEQGGFKVKVTDEGMIAMDLPTFKAYSAQLAQIGQAAYKGAAQAMPNYGAFLK